MLLRSVNVQESLFTVVGGRLVTSVVYDGPSIEAALVVARVQCIRLATPSAIGVGFGVRIPRLQEAAVVNSWFSSSIVQGDRMSCSIVSLLDLIRGDVLECWLEVTQTNRWALVAQGFTVVVR